jgi:hypothetical protein
MVSVINKTSMQNAVMLSLMVTLSTNRFNYPTTEGISKSSHTPSRNGCRSKLQWDRQKNLIDFAAVKLALAASKLSLVVSNWALAVSNWALAVSNWALMNTRA